MQEQTIDVTLTCPRGHARTMTITDSDHEWMRKFVKLMDGTGYRNPPGPESSIGKCHTCGRPVVGAMKVVENAPC